MRLVILTVLLSSFRFWIKSILFSEEVWGDAVIKAGNSLNVDKIHDWHTYNFVFSKLLFVLRTWLLKLKWQELFTVLLDSICSYLWNLWGWKTTKSSFSINVVILKCFLSLFIFFLRSKGLFYLKTFLTLKRKIRENFCFLKCCSEIG